MGVTNHNRKKVLVVGFSQTGQLTNVVRSVIGPLQNSSDIEITQIVPETEKAYPFPWDFFGFLDLFPECVYLDPPPLKPLHLEKNRSFDLVILAYQVWFLSPSLPITAFLQSADGKQLLKDKPVVTIIGCRDMWVMAQERIKVLLQNSGARLIDNVVLTDQGSTLASFVTTPHWMLTGRKDAFWGFPPAGISDREVDRAERFGIALREALHRNLEITGESLLTGLKAVEVNMSLVKSEKIGYRSFLIWGKLLRRIGQQGDSRRKPVLFIYVLFLILMIVTVVPVNMLLTRLLAPLLKKRDSLLKEKYELPSGCGVERMTWNGLVKNAGSSP